MERLHSKCVHRPYFKESWKRNLYIRDWLNMKTAKNKFKHAKKETFQTQTADALHRGEDKTGCQAQDMFKRGG